LSPASLEVRSSRWQLRIRSNQLSSLEEAFGQSIHTQSQSYFFKFNYSHMKIGPFPYVIDINGNNIGTLTDYVYGPIIEMALLEGSKIYMGGTIMDSPICDLY
jgi:hypothetical protein